MRFIIPILALLLAVPAIAAEKVHGSAGGVIALEPIAEFDSPWAMTFIDRRRMLITEKDGVLWLVDTSGGRAKVSGVPKVFAGGQGGLGDVVLHPDFESNRLVYLSFAASNDNGRTRFAKVIRAELHESPPRLENHETIWEQTPAVSGRGHYAHRIVFAPEDSPLAGSMFITSGDRQKLDPAQDMKSALGKTIRLYDDGSIPDDNPFQNHGALAKTFWSIGHRNALGIAFDDAGNLWAHEMGPRHGDELNRINRGANYGWPLVSEGNHYGGTPIPSHDTRPDMTAPDAFWVPTIAPSGLVFYRGGEFPDWQGDAFIGGLRSEALIRIEFTGGKPVEAERFEWGERIREVETAPDGALFVLEDGGRLIRITKG